MKDYVRVESVVVKGVEPEKWSCLQPPCLKEKCDMKCPYEEEIRMLARAREDAVFWKGMSIVALSVLIIAVLFWYGWAKAPTVKVSFSQGGYQIEYYAKSADCFVEKGTNDLQSIMSVLQGFRDGEKSQGKASDQK